VPTSFPNRVSFDGVCFDAFGTLVEVTNPRRFTRRLLGAVHRSVRRDLKARLLRENRPFDEWPMAIGHRWSDRDFSELSGDLRAELSSIQMRPGMDEIWRKLRAQGFKLGVCSNLAAPYGPPVLERLPDNPDAVTFSYLVGCAKPEPKIYTKVTHSLDLPAERILFVGDSISADVDGPAMAGMASMLVEEFTKNVTATSAA